jgi:hypothetical protein
MTYDQFQNSLTSEAPPENVGAPLAALWWDAKGDWTHAHTLVDELETKDGMAVHAYLHRKEGAASNAEYWYERAGRGYRRAAFDDEWKALVEALLNGSV